MRASEIVRNLREFARKGEVVRRPENLTIVVQEAMALARLGIKDRADFLAMAVRTGITINDLATMENVYSPPIGALNEPIALAAQALLAGLRS